MVRNAEWIREKLYPDMQLSLKVKKTLVQGKAQLQGIKVLDTYRFGRTLVLDDIIQTTEKDEFIYHEMMTHVPVFACRRPENVLVIGGGDGGILREVLKHKVKKAVLVEIDKGVIDFCKKSMPSLSNGAFNNKKVDIVIDDGAEYVKRHKSSYDVVIVDSTDPIGPAKVLFQKNFYKNVSNVLKKGGVMVRQSGSTMLQPEELIENYKILKGIFKYVSVYLISIPTYVGGFFSILFASNEVNTKNINIKSIQKRYKTSKIKTTYYNSEIHQGSFLLPEYVKRLTK